MRLGGDLHGEVDSLLLDAEQSTNRLMDLRTDPSEVESEGSPRLLVVLNIKSLKPNK